MAQEGHFGWVDRQGIPERDDDEAGWEKWFQGYLKGKKEGTRALEDVVMLALGQFETERCPSIDVCGWCERQSESLSLVVRTLAKLESHRARDFQVVMEGLRG